MHQNNTAVNDFVIRNSNVLYSKAPKKLKSIFTTVSFTAFSLIIAQLNEVEISEENISEMLKTDDILDELHSKAEDIRDTIYVPQLQKFLSQLTVSCFSTSGWDNQLMWSHYANSYSGICVEYDFSKIEEFIGFIYPVNYITERPTLSMQDLGIDAFDLNGDEKIIKGEIDMSNLFSYMLSKNTCWSYEDEWRIINIGKENTPAFIDLPYIKSITFGLNTDVLCKRMLLAVCKEKGIPCYEVELSKDSYDISRVPIAEMQYDIDEEVAYVTMLSGQMEKTSQMLTNNTEKISEAISQENFDSTAFINVLIETEDFLSNSYFLKSSLNRVCEKSDEDLSTIEIPNEIISAINGINSFVLMATHSIDDVQKSLLGLSFKGLLKQGDYVSSKNHTLNIKELIERFNSYSWNPIFLSNKQNNEQIKNHYDSLINENNDPVCDAAQLQEYMDKWDGQAFIETLELTKDKSILEIGVGTGRLAVKVAPLCGSFTGIDISPKTIERAKENLISYRNVNLICEDFMIYDFQQQFDIIYSSLTFMHICNKLNAIIKVANLLEENGLFILSIDKNQDGYIECGSRKIHIYPDNSECISGFLTAAQLQIEKQFETEFAIVFVSKKMCE